MTRFTRILGLATVSVAVVAIIAPTGAETPSECQSMFRSADLNNDSFLSAREIASSDKISDDLAEAMAARGGVSLQEFMAECSD